jgi:hypothetical protein
MSELATVLLGLLLLSSKGKGEAAPQLERRADPPPAPEDQPIATEAQQPVTGVGQTHAGVFEANLSRALPRDGLEHPSDLARSVRQNPLPSPYELIRSRFTAARAEAAARLRAAATTAEEAAVRRIKQAREARVRAQAARSGAEAERLLTDDILRQHADRRREQARAQLKEALRLRRLALQAVALADGEVPEAVPGVEISERARHAIEESKRRHRDAREASRNASAAAAAAAAAQEGEARRRAELKARLMIEESERRHEEARFAAHCAREARDAARLEQSAPRVPAMTASAAAYRLDRYLREEAREEDRLARVRAIRNAQRYLGVDPDGVVGPSTRKRAAELGVRLPSPSEGESPAAEQHSAVAFAGVTTSEDGEGDLDSLDDEDGLGEEPSQPSDIEAAAAELEQASDSTLADVLKMLDDTPRAGADSRVRRTRNRPGVSGRALSSQVDGARHGLGGDS